MSDSKQPTAEHATADTSVGAHTGIGVERRRAVPLIGFPPKEHPKGVRRLYQRPGSKTYVEIKVADIVRAPSGADKHAKEPGQRVIWVRPDTRVLLAELHVDYFAPSEPPTEHLQWPRD